jgi:hypothetical protein
MVAKAQPSSRAAREIWAMSERMSLVLDENSSYLTVFERTVNKNYYQ